MIHPSNPSKLPEMPPNRNSAGTERRQSTTKLFGTVDQPTPTTSSAVVPAHEELGGSSREKGGKEMEGKNRIELLLRYASLSLMVCQYVCQVLLTRHASTRPQQAPFIKTVAVFLKEALEAVASLLLFLLLTKPKSNLAYRSLLEPAECLQMLLPALAYTLKNFLLFVAIDHLDAATFTVSYQLKILATAVFLVLMLRRRLSPIQWFALFILIGGVAMVELSAKWASATEEAIGLTKIALNSATLPPSNATTANQSFPSINILDHPHSAIGHHCQENFWVGFGAVLGACVLSGYAGVYLEMVVKTPGNSLWLRNFQLCFLSSHIGLAIVLLKDFRQIHAHGPLVGFDALVWAVVLIQVLGGLLVAMVIRYGDNILKAFANSVAILGISLLSWLLFGSSLGWLFGIGTGLVLGAMVLYSLFPAKMQKENEEGE